MAPRKNLSQNADKNNGNNDLQKKNLDLIIKPKKKSENNVTFPDALIKETKQKATKQKEASTLPKLKLEGNQRKKYSCLIHR